MTLRLSKLHQEHPWGIDVHGQRYEVGYWPGDSKSGMFGGNSNWRGPICEQDAFPVKCRDANFSFSQGSLLIFSSSKVYNASISIMVTTFK